MEHELILRIILVTPPGGIDFGLQKGRGSDNETIQTQRSAGTDLHFEFAVRVKSTGNGLSFLGPFAQGPPNGPFVYIDIGTYAGQSGTCWSRRLKIPLVGITTEMIDHALSSGALLEARVPGTGKDGGPTCATVKPFAGWTFAKT